MRNESLMHDATFFATRRVLELFASLLRVEEKEDAFHDVYSSVFVAFKAYEALAERGCRRLTPSNN